MVKECFYEACTDSGASAVIRHSHASNETVRGLALDPGNGQQHPVGFSDNQCAVETTDTLYGQRCGRKQCANGRQVAGSSGAEFHRQDPKPRSMAPAISGGVQFGGFIHLPSSRR